MKSKIGYNTIHYKKKHVQDCFKDLPSRNGERLIFLMADLKKVREVKASRAQGR
jgi:hypothetical protein